MKPRNRSSLAHSSISTTSSTPDHCTYHYREQFGQIVALVAGAPDFDTFRVPQS